MRGVRDRVVVAVVLHSNASRGSGTDRLRSATDDDDDPLRTVMTPARAREQTSLPPAGTEKHYESGRLRYGFPHAARPGPGADR